MNLSSKINKNKWLIAAFVVCAIASLVPIWSVKYLPMVDLPQHAAQVSIIKNYNNPAFNFKEQFELHWFTPYVLPTLLTVLPAYVVGVFNALKVMISLYVILFPLMLCFLFIETKGDPWWGLAGFSLSYGFSFYWGFLVYLMALPVGIFYLIVGLRYKNNPTGASAVALFVTGLLLFFSHAIVYAITNLILVAILFEPERVGRLLNRYKPLLFQLPVPMVWLFINHRIQSTFSSSPEWALNVLNRLGAALYCLLGTPGDEAAQFGMIALLLSLIAGIKLPEQNVRKWWLVPAALYLVVPLQSFGIYFVYPRVALFVLIGGLMCAEQSTSIIRRRSSRVALVLFTISWMGFLSSRFQLNNAEGINFDIAVKGIPVNSRIMDLSFDKDTAFAKKTFDHFSTWIQVERGGILGYSFAYHYNMLARYRFGKEPLHFLEALQIHTDPRNAGKYDLQLFDYFVLRAMSDPVGELDLAVPSPKQLMSHVGYWWVYKRIK